MTGWIGAGKDVSFHREPDNPYDTNAIRVNNLLGVQIRYLPPDLAASLAPLIDSEEIVVEGSAPGPKVGFTCPITLLILNAADPAMQSGFTERNGRDWIVMFSPLAPPAHQAFPQVPVGLVDRPCAAGSRRIQEKSRRLVHVLPARPQKGEGGAWD